MSSFCDKPENWVGIDEAGRGAVIGPLVIAGVAAKSPQQWHQLQEMGVGDSKRFSPQKRQEIFLQLQQCSFVRWAVCVWSAQEVDSNNLSHLFFQGVLSLAQKLGGGCIQLDVPAPSSQVEKFLRDIKQLLPPFCSVEGSIQGESHYPLVAAASIVAKVTRDRWISELWDQYGNFGSGYPSDPRTRRALKQWMESKGGLPPIVRSRWSTLAKLRQTPLF